MKRFFAALLFLPAPAFADSAPSPQPPSPAEVAAQTKIQIGQLLVQLGHDELELSKLRKELDAAKPKDKPKSPH